jgi:hypothetical protein
MPAHLDAWQAALLRQLVERGLRDFQVAGKFADGELRYYPLFAVIVKMETPGFSSRHCFCESRVIELSGARAPGYDRKGPDEKKRSTGLPAP